MTDRRDGFHPRQIMGGLWFLYMALNLALYIVPVLLPALIKLVFPGRAAGEFCYRVMAGIYRAAVAGNIFLFNRILGLRIEVSGLKKFPADKNIAVLVNHQSWLDIPIVQNLLHRRAPIPKFIAKRQVLFIPLVGLICWAYEFPLVHRYGREFLKKHPDKAGLDVGILRDHFSRPNLSASAIILFAEGTRHTPGKGDKQKSPYTHLLKPKAGGLTQLIQALGTDLDGILDLTIVYDAPSPIFWNVLAGRGRRIVVRARKISLEEWFEKDAQGALPVDRALVGERLDELWREKDGLIARVRDVFEEQAPAGVDQAGR